MQQDNSEKHESATNEGVPAHIQGHPFHLVNPSPWPLIGSIATLVLAIGGVLYMHHLDRIVFYIGLGLLFFTFFGWWRDVINEGNTVGVHTKAVQNGLKIGMALFIVSEIMFFAAFFWGYFHVAFNPPEVIGSVWPPKNIITLDPFELPYLNTLLLLLSGTTVTWAHHALLENKQLDVLKGLALTVGLGMIFTIVQGIEYHHATFTIKDGVYPSSFYMATGFHGAHVIIGTIFLAVCLFRARRNEFTPTHHVGFEAAAWYWHFVDVVWLFLFIAIYWWSYNPDAAVMALQHAR
ncbi:MAG: cytochrome c oxidase subunit 3 [Pseudomonadota bacterium]